MAAVRDLKSLVRKGVRVRVPPQAPNDLWAGADAAASAWGEGVADIPSPGRDCADSRGVPVVGLNPTPLTF